MITKEKLELRKKEIEAFRALDIAQQRAFIEQRQQEHKLKTAKHLEEKEKMIFDKKTDSRFLFDRGYRMIYLRYLCIDFPKKTSAAISVAYRLKDKTTGLYEYVFSTKSLKDKFSRVEARKQLVKKIKQYAFCEVSVPTEFPIQAVEDFIKLHVKYTITTDPSLSSKVIAKSIFSQLKEFRGLEF
jgi:hypothetical protein